MRRIEPSPRARRPRSARHDGLAYTLWMPDRRAAAARRGDPPRRRLVQGEPPRLRPRAAPARARSDRVRPARPWRERRPDGRPRAGGRRRDGALLRARARRSSDAADRAARVEHGRLPGDRGRGARRRAPSSRSAPPAPRACARALRSGAARFDADREAVDGVARRDDLDRRVATLELPVLLLHAEGDESVPVEHSRELAAALPRDGSRLIECPAAITARSSTTRSCRRSASASWSGRSGCASGRRATLSVARASRRDPCPGSRPRYPRHP